MEDKYQNWSKILVEPTALNVARLYALESALNHEEQTRRNESKFLKENLQKLIYSIDQLNTQKIGLHKKDKDTNLKNDLMEHQEPFADDIKFPELKDHDRKSKNSKAQTNIVDKNLAKRPSSGLAEKSLKQRL